MPPITHAKVSGVADSPDTSLVRPSEWNDDHVVVQEAWHLVGGGGEPPFQNGWVNFGAGYDPAAYFVDSLGIVHLRGMVKDGVMAAAIFTLPAGYRPPLDQIFPTPSNFAFGYCDVTAAGIVLASLGNNAWFSLNGITFTAA